MNRKEQIIFGILGLLISAGGCIAAWLALSIIFPPTPTAETATSSALTAIAGNANLTQTSETAATAQAIGTAQSDADKDGLTYEQELKIGTNPEQPDTDGDELNDGTDPKPIQPAITLGTAKHLEPLTTKLNYQLAAAGQLAFSPNGTYLASASSDRDGFPICIWQMSDGTLQKTLFGHSNGIFGVTFSKDGVFVASGAADTSVRVWRVRDGQSLYVLNDALSMTIRNGHGDN